MKNILRTLLIIVLLQVVILIAFGQTDTTNTVNPMIAGFPGWFLIPLFLGMAFHWLKGYTRGTIGSGLGNYIMDNIGQTVSAIVAAVGQLVTMWATNAGLFETTPISAMWIVFLIGYGSDSLLNGSGPFIKK